jgi:predicted CXXCH cytochrome family protein
MRFVAGIVLSASIVLIAFVFWQMPVHSQGDDPPATGDNSYCVLCHSQPNQSMTLADGSTLDISINPEDIAHSVHGNIEGVGTLGCIDCHGENAFPHDDPPPINRRAFTVQMAQQVCANCHTGEAHNQADGVHQQALDAGNLTAATCTDCHGAHNVQQPGDPQLTANTCGSCHTFVFDQFNQSVHGVALFAGDPNVPTCTNCHGVHGIEHPTTAEFRNDSPQVCGTCHGDKDLMDQYGIETNVFNSYLSEFHGTTVALFEEQDPDVASNKAVCYDCHGVHDIAQVDANNSRVVRQNLLETCQRCHPDATSNFPDAWVGHYPPTLKSHPLLFTVRVFYNILVPGTLGAFVLLVSTDVFRRVRQRRRKD